MQEQIQLKEAAQQMGVSRWTIRRWSQHRHNGCPPIVPLTRRMSVMDRLEWEVAKRRILRKDDCNCGLYRNCRRRVAA